MKIDTKDNLKNNSGVTSAIPAIDENERNASTEKNEHTIMPVRKFVIAIIFIQLAVLSLLIFFYGIKIQQSSYEKDHEVMMENFTQELIEMRKEDANLYALKLRDVNKAGNVEYNRRARDRFQLLQKLDKIYFMLKMQNKKKLVNDVNEKIDVIKEKKPDVNIKSPNLTNEEIDVPILLTTLNRTKEESTKYRFKIDAANKTTQDEKRSDQIKYTEYGDSDGHLDKVRRDQLSISIYNPPSSSEVNNKLKSQEPTNSSEGKIEQQTGKKSANQELWDIRDFVSCNHLKFIPINNTRISPSKSALKSCWHHGMTRDELQFGAVRKNNKFPKNILDLENFYIPCADVFNDNFERFTTSLINDYRLCLENNAIDGTLKTNIENRFDKLFSIIRHGHAQYKLATSKENQTVIFTVNNNLVKCNNASPEVKNLCRNIGVTVTQITSLIWEIVQDKWIIEEDLSDLYLTCDDIFAGNHLSMFSAFPLKEYYICLLNSFNYPQPRFVEGKSPRFTVIMRVPHINNK